MDFERVYIKNSSDLQAFHPQNLSTHLIVELESSIVDRPRKLFANSSMENIIIWITLVFIIRTILWAIVKDFETVKTNNKLIFSLISTKCHSCQFYAKNPYLKCAVHPAIVLTRQAKDCRDYGKRKN